MAAGMSAVVFTLSWWLGLYLLARDPRKPVLVLAALGLSSFAAVVALDAIRLTAGPHAVLLSRSLHNWQNAAARVIAADLRGTPVAAESWRMR